MVPRVVCEVLLAQESAQRSRECKEKSLGASQKLAHPVMHKNLRVMPARLGCCCLLVLRGEEGNRVDREYIGIVFHDSPYAWGCFFLQQAQLS